METKTASWYLRHQKKKKEGPYTSQEIRELDEKGKLTKDMFVWRKGLEKWVPITRIKGLQFKQKQSWWQFFKDVTFEPIPSGWYSKFVWSLKKFALVHVMIFALLISGTIGIFVVGGVVGGVSYAMMTPEQRQEHSEKMAEARAKAKEARAANAQKIAEAGKNNERIREAAANHVDSIYGLSNEQKVDAFMDYYVRHGGTDAFKTRQGLTLALKRAQREYDFDRGKISIW
jgi:hypothetical protein